MHVRLFFWLGKNKSVERGEVPIPDINCTIKGVATIRLTLRTFMCPIFLRRKKGSYLHV